MADCISITLINIVFKFNGSEKIDGMENNGERPEYLIIYFPGLFY